MGESVRPFTTLFAFSYWIAFLDPICAEIVWDVEGFCVGETHGVEEVVGGFHVGAVGPGTASAVEHDEFVAREGVDAGAEALESRRIGGGSDVFGVGDVGLGVEDVRSNVDEEGLVGFWGLQNFDKVVGGDCVGGSDLAGLEGESGDGEGYE